MDDTIGIDVQADGLVIGGRGDGKMRRITVRELVADELDEFDTMSSTVPEGDPT